MWKVRELADKVTNVVMNYTEIESKVREATNDEAWGPTGSIKYELSQATFSYDQFPEVMGMLWKRIAENKRNPRRVYKSLLLLHHLMLHGSDRVIRATNDRIYELRSLTDYHIVYEPGFSLDSIIPPEITKDSEINVRVKAKELVELLQDEERLKDERKKAKKNRDKYVGIGSDRWMSSGTTSSWGSSGGDFDDMGEDVGRPKSPVSSPSFNRSTSSSTTSSAAKKPGFQISSSKKPADDDDDFNPREGEDFGDFKAASSVAQPQAASTGTDNGFQADFASAFAGGQSQPSEPAFGEFSSVPAAAAASGGEDLFSLSNSLFAGNGVPPPVNPPPVSVSVNPSTAAANNHVDLLGDIGFGSSGLDDPLGNLSNNSFTSQAQPNQGAVSQSLQGINFGGAMSSTPVYQQTTNLLDSILEPASSNVQTNNINNNSASTQNKQASNLKGTTWGDLNFSLDDLNIGGSKNQTTSKVPMNQMKFQQK